MPAVIFPGPEGRLEGRFQPGPRPRAPVAMILHPHPQAGGTMNDRITQSLYKTFTARGFATLRFNFRGVGRSQGSFDNGIGELSDAAAALDWFAFSLDYGAAQTVRQRSEGAVPGMVGGAERNRSHSRAFPDFANHDRHDRPLSW